MLSNPSFPVTALLLVCVALPTACGCQPTSEPSKGGLQSVLDESVSPAFGATIIIILTGIMSASAYLCFLKYVCAGCCRPTQVAPAVDMDPDKVEEQV